MYKRIVKGGIAIMLAMLIIELPAMHFKNEELLKAETSTSRADVKSGTQVRIGGTDYTLIGNNKFLLNSSLGTAYWEDATALAESYKESASLSNKEKSLVSASSLASMNDFVGGSVAYGPSLGEDWWLQDKADYSQTRSYVSANNIYNEGRIEKFQDYISKRCKAVERKVSGGGLIAQAYNVAGTKYVKATRHYYCFNMITQDKSTRVSTCSAGACRPNSAFSNYGPGATITMCDVTKPAIGKVIPMDVPYRYKKGFDSFFNSDVPTSNATRTVRSYAPSKDWDETDYAACPTTVQEVDQAATRPIIVMDSSIFSTSTTKNTSTSSVLGSYPDAGSGPYTIQVEDSSLNMQLDTSDDTVKDSGTMELDINDIRNSNGVLTIPYDTSGSSYDGGSTFISAMTDSDHYSKLAPAVNGTGTAVIDLNNLLKKENGKIIPQVVNLNLYQEEITADGHTDFISSPLSVSIVMKQKQSIEQVEGDASETVYGTPIDLHFKTVESSESPASISDKPITFSLSKEDQPYAQLSDKGDGVVEVKPLKAGKTINVLVDKEGDEVYGDIKQLSIPIELKKKPITIKAESYSKGLGEPVPDYALIFGDDDLVNGDVIPPGIKAVTSYVATDGKLMSETSGTDITVEEDDSDEVLEFKEKYEVTYVKGTLVVGVTLGDETWLEVTPEPDSNGWNTTDVTVKPSAASIAKGFTRIALNDGPQAEEILIDTSIKKENLKFKLYKENGSLTNELSLSKDINIDKDAPVAEISEVSDENNWTAQKTVKFTTTETGSGIQAISVKKPDGSEVEVTGDLSGNSFSFIADVNGVYTIDVKDKAGNKAVQLQKEIQFIDNVKLDITNIQNDGSGEDDLWKPTERVVTFHISVGQSGLKEGMPQVMMGTDVLPVTDNADDTYSFTATKSGAYKVIAESVSGDKKEISGTIQKLDNTAPTLSIDVDKIPETLSMKLLNTLTGGAFYKGGFIVTVTATDAESGIETITSPNGKGTITSSGKTKILTYTVSDNFKGTVEATAVNMAGLDTTETTQKIVNENNNQDIKITPKGVSGHINADSVFEAVLTADIRANYSGLKEISYIVDGNEEILKSYTAGDAEDDSLTLEDTVTIPLTEIIQNAPADHDEITLKIKASTNAGNTLSKDVIMKYDINAASISIISVDKEDEWAYQKQVDFSVNEEGSGIDTIAILKPDGTQADVNGELTGNSFDFLADQTGTYTIDVEDKAGNKALQISKFITKIDRDKPTVEDVSTMPGNDTWAKKKTVTFHVLDLLDPDSGSGVDQNSIVISSIKGKEPEVSCTGNKDDLTCSFEVTQEDTYTINAKDITGNEAASQDVDVQKVDATAVDIKDVHNDGSSEDDPWVIKERIVKFKISAGTSGLKTGMPQVSMEDEQLTVTDEGNNNYNFSAKQNGSYKIVAENMTGEKKEITGTISKIDKELPVISQLLMEQNTNLTEHDERIHISFKVEDNASGIASVSYSSDGKEFVLSSENDSYSFLTSKNGDYIIKVVDKAGNAATKTATVSLPDIQNEPEDLSIYENDALSLNINVKMNDTVTTGRTYEWFYIDEDGNETSVKSGTLGIEDAEQSIPFPYSKADAGNSGAYRCMIRNGDGYYLWSHTFKLTVITDPVAGFVTIPSQIEMKKSNDESASAQAVFTVELMDSKQDSPKPMSKFHVKTTKELVLKEADAEDSYSAIVYKDIDGTYLPYESGDIAELSYDGIKQQNVKLLMKLNGDHIQGTYQGVLRFVIRYGEGESGL